ncbi:MAG: hypothetical protein AUJ96_06900 [Armatimonadetes bacterium CG2_30_66_41]|nr:MAG: hypothetical protein AUJ96_06900 [Armatimonadetes bacterium CG2_30_66_41]
MLYPRKSISEYSSLIVGSRQSLLPASRNDLAPATASANVFFAPGSFCQTRPVTRSVTVPSPLFR